MIKILFCLSFFAALLAQADQLAYFQNESAYKFSVGHVPSAKMLVEQGLKSFPENGALTELKKLIDEEIEKQKQQQKQQNGQSADNKKDQQEQQQQDQERQKQDQKKQDEEQKKEAEKKDEKKTLTDEEKKQQQAEEKKQAEKEAAEKKKADEKKEDDKKQNAVKLSKEDAEKILQSLRDKENDYKKKKRENSKGRRGRAEKDW